MSTSGTVGTTVFTTRKLIEHALGRCKIKRAKITAEMLDISKDCLWLSMSHLVNRGVPLWALDWTILPLYQNSRFVTLPVGSIDILTANLRTLTRLTGSATVASSAGGTAAYAFDDDFDTACTQTAPNGNISANFTSDTLVTTVGLLFNASATITLNFERSDDAVTWTPVQTETAVAAVAGQWQWFDLDGNLAAAYFRVRASGGGTLDVAELYFGNNAREIQISRLNLNDYANMPDKYATGTPLQYYLDKQRVQPQMNLWPACDLNNRYSQVVMRNTRQLQDVGSLTQEVEVPQRWFDATIWDLAWRCAAEIEEAKADPMALMKIAGEILNTAERQETDDSPTYYVPDISVYTRS